ncbi:MAG: SDR family NAD(P)-dependent oxidoreductase, partial [Xanthomonadales bacterium]|nr:SDR family NAD(P)-dependent oxidoreductase [Xanthomonadales bacterium]
MSQRIAVVTGGIGGLGSEICRYLARAGCQVIAADLPGHDERIAQFESNMREHGERIKFAALDVGDFDHCATMISTLERDYGSVDILVNAAGIT